MLPKGWKSVLLDQVAKRGSGHTPKKDFSDYWNGGVKWISLSDSGRLDKGWVTETDKEISYAGVQNSSAVIHPVGTVVLSRDAGVGKSGVIAEDMAVSQHFIAWDCSASTDLHNWYLYYWLQQQKSEFERVAVGSTIKTIGLPYFKKLKITLPPLKEQHRIVEILSTWDVAIATTEKLLFNSRKRKCALIRDLLHGAKRLSGFGNEWRKAQFQDLCTIYKGSTLSKSDLNLSGKNACILYGELFTTYAEVIDKVRSRTSSDQGFLAKQGDVLMPTATTTVAKDLAKASALMVNDVFVGGDAIVIRPKAGKLYGEFLAYAMTHIQQREIVARAQGATIVHLSANDLLDITLNFPSHDEQLAICDVLRKASAEICLYEQCAERLQSEKSALMSQLLAGERRVELPVIESEAQA